MLIETFGSLIKEEKLKTVTDGIIPNTLVLENLEAFPGYYGNTPTDKIPDAFFLITTQKESTEKILRLSHIIKLNTNIQFDGGPCRICIHNDSYYGIRIRGLKEYGLLETIQSNFMDADIKFMKKKSIDTPALIHLKKVFSIKPISDRIYEDSTDKNMYYLHIDKQINWSHFKTLTTKVKNNLVIRDFDAALSVVYSREVLDLIRIYAKDIKINTLKEIMTKYDEYMAKSLYEIRQ